MSHFAQIDENNIVTRVLSIEQDMIDTGLFGDPSSFVQTSYNTRCGIHYGQDGEPDGGIALRGHFAGIGYSYDASRDIFLPPKTFPSWILNETNYLWYPPIPHPDDGKDYLWNESASNWVLVE